MQKQAPTLGRLLTMVLFALSCFGLLLFLWLSFGGPVPLKPQGYRFQVAFPEATQLGLEADVRVAGVSVGKVRAKELDPAGNRTLATIELDRRFAPINRDARAILRQKTLLGETYVELTPGTGAGGKVPEGGRLANSRVAPAVELDEIFQALDPQTRQAFRIWQQDLAKGVRGRGRDLNDAIGNLPEFAADATDLLTVLDRQEGAVSRLVRNTGVVFGALTENEAQLRNLITNSGDVFEATASQNDALAEAFRIFPTFLDESRLTLDRLKTFARDTDPLIRDLEPVARDLRPTLRATRELAPDLKRFFTDLDPLIDVSKKGLPALKEVLSGAKPLLGELGPFLQQLNPILQWLELHQYTVSDFIQNGAGAIADTVDSRTGVGHYLRQFGPGGSESAALYRERPASNRGNAYLPPVALQGPDLGKNLIFPNFDCKPSKGPKPPPAKGGGGDPACFVATPLEFQGKKQGAFAHVGEADYGAKRK